MKKSLFVLLAAALLFVGCGPKNTIPNIIFDTDIGNDIDDTEALDLLYKYMDEGKINLLGICLNKDGVQTAQFIDLMGNFYGYPDIPLGVLRTDIQMGKLVSECYTTKLLEMKDEEGNPVFKTSGLEYDSLPDSWKLYRKLLAESPDKSVTIVSVGFFTNLSMLMDSPADEISPLTGMQLIKKKVKLLSIMAGRFIDENLEYNVKYDVPAAQKIFNDWPSEIGVLSWELGQAVRYPASSIESDFEWGVPHPLKEGYIRYRPMPYNNNMYDPTAVVYGAGESQMFEVGEPGKVRVNSIGVTRFNPCKDGNTRIMYVDDERAAALVEYFKGYLTRKPKCMQ